MSNSLQLHWLQRAFTVSWSLLIFMSTESMMLWILYTLCTNCWYHYWLYVLELSLLMLRSCCTSNLVYYILIYYVLIRMPPLLRYSWPKSFAGNTEYSKFCKFQFSFLLKLFVILLGWCKSNRSFALLIFVAIRIHS